MSSTPVAYDPALFLVERATTLSARLGEFLVGASPLGSSGTGTWLAVPLATFSFSSGYNPDEKGTLIIDGDSASVALSFWDNPGDILYPLDRIRVSYDGKELFTGTVDSTSLKYEADPTAAIYGAHRRVDFTASILGSYAIALSKQVTFTALPAETAIHRIRRWITVGNW